MWWAVRGKRDKLSKGDKNMLRHNRLSKWDKNMLRNGRRMRGGRR